MLLFRLFRRLILIALVLGGGYLLYRLARATPQLVAARRVSGFCRSVAPGENKRAVKERAAQQGIHYDSYGFDSPGAPRLRLPENPAADNFAQLQAKQRQDGSGLCTVYYQGEAVVSSRLTQAQAAFSLRRILR